MIDALKLEYERRKADVLASVARVGRTFYPIECVNVTLACGDLQTEIPLPEDQRPWWVDFDENQLHEPLATRTFVDEIDPGDIVWDMGSKYGYFAHIAAELSGPEHVHLFEANRRTCKTRLDAFNKRAWDGQLSIVPKAVSTRSNQWEIAGDDYARDHSPPDFIKMDIEGGELPAVTGLTEVIHHRRPTLLIEVHPPKIKQLWNDSDDSLIDLLSDNYELSICWEFRESESEWEPFDREEWRHRSPYAQYYQILCRTD